MNSILLTGAAGFIGWKTAEKLLSQGHQVLGVDNLNGYYDVRLKEYRLNQLLPVKDFAFSAQTSNALTNSSRSFVTTISVPSSILQPGQECVTA
jgi:nucleoside-diphosphate-sugar epimerase